jgi:hypothetical protein
MYYQFSDHSTRFEELWSEALEVGSNPEASPTEKTVRMLLNPLLVHGLYTARRLSHFPDVMSLPEDKRLAHVQTALAQRSTSWIQDEAVCLATLIGHSLEAREAVLDASSEDRMKVLFQSMKSVPAGLLFVRRPRYQDPGIRWIPKTLLWSPSEVHSPLFQKYGNAKVSPRGLVVNFPSVRFRHGIKVDPEQPGLIAFEQNHVLWSAAFTKENESNCGPFQWAQYVQRDVALVFGTSLSGDVLSHNGALVSVRHVDGDENFSDGSRIYARWEADLALAAASLWISNHDFALQQDFEAVSAEQEWCIG